MYSKIYSAVVSGLVGAVIEIETQINQGMPYHVIVGLPSQTIRESKDRVKSAIRESGNQFPDNRITQNLYPAHLRKEGTHLDLALAVGILECQKSHKIDLDKFGFLGELSLEGSIKPVSGVLALVESFVEQGIFHIILPLKNKEELVDLQGVHYYVYSELRTLIEDLKNGSLNVLKGPIPSKESTKESSKNYIEVQGLNHVIRALTIGVIGNFNILLVGPPGCGKTMLAERLPSIMPDLTKKQYLEISKIYGLSGEYYGDFQRPFRMPHHSITPTGMIGGTSQLIPGEISKAHHGVLFLDEILEFKNNVLQLLREPISSKKIHLVKNFQQVTFPCDFMMIATMNPCPCGYHLSKQQRCTCNAFEIKRYLNKMSGALLDRFHMIVYLDRVNNLNDDQLAKSASSEEIRKLVTHAKSILDRHDDSDEEEFLSPEAKNLLGYFYENKGLSMRGYNQLISVAKVIAFLNGGNQVGKKEVYEAISYNNLSRLKEGV